MKKLIFIILVFKFFGFSNAQTVKDYSSLKAVLVVGHQEDGTASAMEAMNKIANFLKKNEVKVFRFYDDETDWNKIKTASKNANFFIYSGHGSNIGEGGKTGGLILKTRVTSKQIIEELQLKNKSVVIFKSVCGGAGSSAGDNRDVGIAVAETRVSDYSKPFFDVGASCYYANNMGSGCLSFLKNFFSGKTINECFRISAKGDKIEMSRPYKYDSNKQISIAGNKAKGFATLISYDIKTVRVGAKTSSDTIKTVKKVPAYKSYDIAYVANPDFTIKDMLNF